MSPVLILIALLLLLVLFRLGKIKKWIINRWEIYRCMAKMPGPMSLPIIGATYMFKLDRVVPAFSYQLEELSIKYGAEKGIFQLWLGPQPVVALITCETAETLLSSNSEITKSDNYDFFLPWLGTGLLMSTGSKWRSRRKMLTPTFHYSILDCFVDVFNEQALVLVDVLGEQEVDTMRTFDMFPYIKRCALDIICGTAMGVQINAQRDLKSEYVRAVQDMSEIAFEYQRSPWLWPSVLFYALGKGFRYRQCLAKLTTFTKKVINDRSQSLRALAKQKNLSLAELRTETGNKRPAFLDLLLMISEENKLTDDDIHEEVETFMFEGHDTTSSGMAWTLWLLGNLPIEQNKVYEELKSVLGADHEGPITTEQLKQMKYLEMCIKESLRLVPPVPMFARSLQNNMVIGGFEVPAGVTAIVIPIVIHRDEKNFPDSRRFNPEHFNSQRSSSRHPYSYVPFSAGPRNCIGQKFALLEEKTVLAHVLYRYSVQSMDTIENVRALPEIITRPLNGFPVRFHKRSSNQ